MPTPQHGRLLQVELPVAAFFPLAALARRPRGGLAGGFHDVLEELTLPRKPTDPETNLMKEADRELRGSSIELIEVLAGSEEDATRSTLMAFVDRGEAASIAVASRRLDLVFVTEDVRAVQGKPRLYRELPGEVGRIMGLHAFLRVLVERGALSATLARAVAVSRDLDPPLWWAGWTASLPP
ncbi:hypothetical protein [Sorangium sp. So ce542]|uniref:hypothetical protein n=1 Tax=Sorangium sp. So ce542 TaxID=3133316 RepID=UPI003F637150